MTVLGIHAFIHDSGACIVRDGRVSAISEERLDRRKHSDAFPRLSVAYVLKELGIGDINEVGLVVYDMFERQGGETLRGIRGLGYTGRAECIRHHDAHAASAYFASPFDDAAVLVVDGAGSNGAEYPAGRPPHFLADHSGWMQEVQSFYRGSGNSLDVIRRTFATPSHAMGVGFLYGASCEYLGFDKLDGGKLMGLAAYGKANQKFNEDLFEDMSGDLLIPFERNHLLKEDWKKFGQRIHGGAPRRLPGGRIHQAHMDAAFHMQHLTEKAMLLLARNLKHISGSGNLCIAGGVALNGPANTLIARESGFGGVFIQPAANDYGIPLGCALYGFHVLLGRKKRFRMKHAFLARKYSESEIDRELKSFGGKISVEKKAGAVRETALAISQGKIVGWFDGAAEFGPRALGDRSIIADPRRADMKDILNERVKFREPFRPYAPAVMAERAGEYFEDTADSPYMLFIVRAKPGKGKLIPAVLHVDGTARLQTVDKKICPEFYGLIEAFDSITGIPMVLNTSMNVSGEPIVETPGDAVRCLLGTGMDILFMQGRLIKKNS
jgi:carbamoyltransferase